jgi:hypothetical protein
VIIWAVTRTAKTAFKTIDPEDSKQLTEYQDAVQCIQNKKD